MFVAFLYKMTSCKICRYCKTQGIGLLNINLLSSMVAINRSHFQIRYLVILVKVHRYLLSRFFQLKQHIESHELVRWIHDTQVEFDGFKNFCCVWRRFNFLQQYISWEFILIRWCKWSWWYIWKKYMSK